MKAKRCVSKEDLLGVASDYCRKIKAVKKGLNINLEDAKQIEIMKHLNPEEHRRLAVILDRYALISRLIAEAHSLPDVRQGDLFPLPLFAQRN